MHPSSLSAVSRAIVACQRCPRLRSYCRDVATVRVARYRNQSYWGKPVPGFGDPKARLLIVGLAPGAHGANRTGRMFTGDSSGDWLFGALHRHGFASRPESTDRRDGLTLTDCYIAAAGRCAPPDNKPLPAELDRCRPFLEAEIRLLERVAVVVALGRIGHDAFLRASGLRVAIPAESRPTFGHGATTRLPDGRTLIASYHPSRQNTNTGRLTPTMWDAVFAEARRLVDTG